MKSKSLYVILDKQYLKNQSLKNLIDQLLKGKVDFIQYRNKTGSEEEKFQEASMIAKLLKNTSSKFIINDDPALAKRVEADGVHLGQEDGSLAKARQVLGEAKIIGVSTHTVLEALQAKKEGANYIAVGDLFGTQTKAKTQSTSLSIFKEICEKVDLPIVGIGGITLQNKETVFAAGADAIAVSKGVLCAEDIENVCVRFKF